MYRETDRENSSSKGEKGMDPKKKRYLQSEHTDFTDHMGDKQKQAWEK